MIDGYVPDPEPTEKEKMDKAKLKNLTKLSYVLILAALLVAIFTDYIDIGIYDYHVDIILGAVVIVLGGLGVIGMVVHHTTEL